MARVEGATRAPSTRTVREAQGAHATDVVGPVRGAIRSPNGSVVAVMVGERPNTGQQRREESLAEQCEAGAGVGQRITQVPETRT